MTIASRDQVRAAVDFALQLYPQRDLDAALCIVAQAFALPVEAVQEAFEVSDDAFDARMVQSFAAEYDDGSLDDGN